MRGTRSTRPDPPIALAACGLAPTMPSHSWRLPRAEKPPASGSRDVGSPRHASHPQRRRAVRRGRDPGRPRRRHPAAERSCQLVLAAQLAWNGLILSALYQASRARRATGCRCISTNEPDQPRRATGDPASFPRGSGPNRSPTAHQRTPHDGAAREVDAGGDAARIAAETSSIVKHTVTSHAIESVSEAGSPHRQSGSQPPPSTRASLARRLVQSHSQPQDDTISSVRGERHGPRHRHRGRLAIGGQNAR